MCEMLQAVLLFKMMAARLISVHISVIVLMNTQVIKKRANCYSVQLAKMEYNIN